MCYGTRTTTYCEYCEEVISVVGPLYYGDCQRCKDDPNLPICDRSTWVITEEPVKKGFHNACKEAIESANADMPKWI